MNLTRKTILKGLLCGILGITMILQFHIPTQRAFAAEDESAVSNVNIALNKKIYASGSENDASAAQYANDGDLSTRWGSDFLSDAYIYVDLYGTYDVCKVVLNWEAAYGKQYSIDVSLDGENWTTVYTENAGDGEVDTVEFAAVSARYVKMQGIERYFSAYGYSLYEFEVYATEDSYAQIGDVEDVEGVNLALNKQADASSGTAALAVDGNMGSRWESEMSDPQWWSVDLGKKYNIETIRIAWETACSKAYTIQVSDDGENWTIASEQNDGQGGTEIIELNDASGRYIKLVSTERATVWGNSFYEFEVYGSVYKEIAPEETTPEETSPEESTPSQPSVVTPVPVTGLQAVCVNGQVVLTWDDCGAVCYKVARFDGKSGYENLTYRATAAGWTDTTAELFQFYYYRVIPYFMDENDQLVTGPIGEAVSVLVTGQQPDQVVNVTTTIQDGSVILNWDNCNGAQYYKISRASGNYSQYFSIKYNLTENSYTDTDVPKGINRYKVVGYYKDATGDWIYGELSDTLYVTIE